jgi:hypothetical protein
LMTDNKYGVYTWKVKKKNLIKEQKNQIMCFILYYLQ